VLAITVDRERLRNAFAQMSAIGATPKGGVHRLALSDADRDARDLLKTWCQRAGYEVRIDRMGSMFARRQGRNESLPPILIGSHLDSQPMAGRFDGPVGVLAALEVLQTLDDHRIATEHPVDLVNWTNEEGARFNPPLLASGVFAGVHQLGFALACTDATGLSVEGELRRIGYAGAHDVGGPVAGYIEVHIEQGTVLEEAGAVIGSVTGVVGIRDTHVTVLGEDTHAGPLPMDRRRDALVGAAQMVLAARQIGLAHAPDARVTVGRLSVPSDSHSVVPGRVEMVLDVRHPEKDSIEQLQAELEARFRTIAAECQLDVEFRQIWNYQPVMFDPHLRSAIERASDAHGYRHLPLPSRAGHDAWNMARVAPSAMIFIPCRNGISHNELEFAEDVHIAAGADVLLAALLAADARL
jgi:beta-ureidopropionase / N-carbamoyl-L-amino-acid hydrolase